MSCEIKYDSLRKGDLESSIGAYLELRDFELFKEDFLEGEFPKDMTFTMKVTDSSSDIHKAIITFYEDFQTLKENFIREKADETILDELEAKILSEFHIEADLTQSVSDGDDNQTIQEFEDTNTANLQAHLKEIYGPGSYGIIKKLNQDVYDALIGAAYYESQSGDIIEMTNEVLNKNIEKHKATLLQAVKTYLDTNNIKYDNTREGILHAFYTVLSTSQDLPRTLNKIYSNKLRKGYNKDKINLFSNLVEKLLENQEFVKAMAYELNGAQINKLSRNLYSGDTYSRVYQAVKKYITKNKLTDLLPIIESIEQVDVDLLMATNAYTTLTHFDELLVDRMGKQIDIAKGTFGKEDPNKYSHFQDTSNQRQGWNTSEYIGSEKYVAKLAEAFISQIRVYNHKTDKYKNRRVDSTSLIMAGRHLIDDLVYNRLESTAKDVRDELRQIVMSFHQNPQEKLQQLLELLFDNNGKPLVYELSKDSDRKLSDFDLDVLYSVYLKGFNRKDDSSFINQEYEKTTNYTPVYNIMRELAMFIDGNVVMDYAETVINSETGLPTLKIRRPFFSDLNLSRTRASINHAINVMSSDKRSTLQEQYNLQESITEENTTYTISIDNSTISLVVPKVITEGMMDPGKGLNIQYFEDSTFFDELFNVDLDEFKYALEEGRQTSFTGKELSLYKTLQFIDAYLPLDILSDIGFQILQNYKDTYIPVNGMNNYLMPLVQLAMRAAYINNQYVKANGIPMSEFLEGDPIYEHYKSSESSTVFVSAFDNVRYMPVNSRDEVIRKWADATSIFLGEASKATTKDSSGNSIPNNGVNKQGAIWYNYTEKQKNTNCDSLMFVQNDSLIKAVYHDLEASNIHGDTKSIKQFTANELFYHSIFNKFWGNYNQGRHSIVVQPTTYSDKTTFLNWEISTLFDGEHDIMLDDDYVSTIIEQYKKTLGTFYQNVWETNQNKLQQVAAYYNQQNNTSYSIKEVLKRINEEQIQSIAGSLGFDLEKDSDYRVRSRQVPVLDENGIQIIKNGKPKTKSEAYCTFNEILEYNARVYNNDELLLETLNHEKYNFLKNLVNYGMSFRVIEFNDSYSNYTGDTLTTGTSKNGVILNILKFFEGNNKGRKEFFQNWVDANTGKLILAKSNGLNILSSSDIIAENDIELNPFLDKFFYIEGFTSNNLRMSLTGSEINHPDKAKKTLFDIVKKTSDYTSFKIATGFKLSEAEYNEVKVILDQCEDITDLKEFAYPDNNYYENFATDITDTRDVKLYELSGKTNLQQLVLDIAKPTDSYNILTWIINNSDLKNYSKEINVRIDNVNSTLGGYVNSNFDKYKGRRAYYEANNRTIHINGGANFNNGDAVPVITHEVLHALTVNKILNSPNKSVEFTEILNNYLSQYYNKYSHKNYKYQNLDGSLKENALEEFIADVWADYKTINDLKEFKSNKKSLWDTVKDFIVDLFGDVEKDSLFVEISAYLKDLLDSPIKIRVKSGETFYESIETEASKAIIKRNPYVKQIYDKSILKIINTAQGTQFKRNVIIPATLHYCQQNDIQGIPPTVKCAVIYDEKAKVFNYRGDSDKIDSCDGSAHIIPFQAMLENLSLGSQAVGMVKKPIWHSYNTENGTAFLAKFATYTMTNENMKHSMDSETSLFRLFRQMTNLQWEESINLTKSMFSDVEMGANSDMELEYDNWIKNIIFEKSRLFYENAYGEQIEITGFNKEIVNGNTYYYTTEKTKLGDEYKVFHMFAGEDSDHYTFNSVEEAASFALQGGHTINSLFELHTALGSVRCVDEDGNTSDFNSKVVVNFMNNVGSRKEGIPKDAFVSQNNYYQPLKKYYIGYALNNTAVKNGAKNINQAEAWKGRTKLRYFEVDSDGLGMQMNADHDVINSELTEFSQVIAATSAYGWTFRQANTIFKGLAKTAMTASQQMIDAADNLLKGASPEARSALYEAVGRILLVESSIKDTENLTNVIMEAVRRVFNKNKDHSNDSFKIPFSDPNIYSEFVSTLASTITKSSIKRKHPGTASVIAPAYNIMTSYEVGEKRYTQSEIIKVARNHAKEQILKNIRDGKIEGYDSESDSINGKALSFLSFRDLIEISNDAELVGLTDVNKFNNIIVKRYLYDKQRSEPDRPTSYFQPTDVVRVFEPGKESYIIDLNNMDDYYDFKERIFPEGTTFKSDTITPRNLRPSLIKWQYYDGTRDIEGNLVPRWMNFFDLSVCKNAFRAALKPSREEIQQAMHDLKEGFFILNGVRYEVIPGTLENAEAEIIMSNMYAETFGIDGESLQEVKDQGAQYFRDQIKTKLHAPKNRYYDVALLKDSGKHTLIRFGKVKEDKKCVEDKFTNIYVNEKDEIYYMKGNKPAFKIGKYFELNDDERADLFLKDGVIMSKSGKKIDQDYYRINGSRIQKRVDFVKKYTVTLDYENKKTKKVYKEKHTLYQIIDRDELKNLYGSYNDADNQIGDIVTNIYLQDKFKFVEFNDLRAKHLHNQYNNGLYNYFTRFDGNHLVSEDHKKQVRMQLEHLKNNDSLNSDLLTQMKESYYQNEANKKYVSFLDSLKVVASRIPAQTLQSFMAMKIVGWTENTNNVAYVSHWQLFLQGSDLDIDKANIMGQSYDDNGVYIGWSPLFDYTSLETLELSKQLPIPENIDIVQTADGIDINEELIAILNNVDDNINPISNDVRTTVLQAYINILNKISDSDGKVKYNIEHSDKVQNIFYKLYQHLKYVVPDNISEAAYKNAASANIYFVSHDIRNRDQSYTAISMDTLRDAAANSPKGEQAASLNMLNPLTKYIMQYQNLVGKNVISIAANGEKVWFNAYYYWTKLAKSGDTRYLQYETVLNRIQGRSKTRLNQLSSLSSRSIRNLPDLDWRDDSIRNNLATTLEVDITSEGYKYVDLLISELLSAATDNAKELILAKINAGTDFARMYVYLIMSGYNISDIVSFMTSPAAEFIGTLSGANMFDEESIDNKPETAIQLAMGKVKSKSFLHGKIDNSSEEDFINGNRTYTPKLDYTLSILRNAKYVNEALTALGLNTIDQIYSLDQLMEGFIRAAAVNKDIDIRTLITTSDPEINNYLYYCNTLATSIRNVARSYGSISEYTLDVQEFNKVYSLATEISNIASGWLGLNQGLPTDELGTLKRFSQMKQLITDRERVLQITPDIFTTSEDMKKQIKARRKLDRVINNIVDNNPSFSREEVEQALRVAYDKGLIGTFDVYKYLTNETYRKDMIEYNHYIKGTLNVLHMMEEIPHYKATLECFKGFVVSKDALATKSRLVNRLIKFAGYDFLDDKQLRNIMNYVNNVLVTNFTKQLDKPIVLNTAVDSFDECFNSVIKLSDGTTKRIQTDRIDLGTLHGVATFKHWIEHEFLDYLRDNHKDNPAVDHLRVIPENGKDRNILSVDVDLLNPDTTTITRQSYDEILRGMALFELEPFENTGYSIADLLQLYNIIVNGNQYGAERLTTAFKACTHPNNILNQYYRYISALDYNPNIELDFSMMDYYISAAPLVNPGKERFRKEPFIKVADKKRIYQIKEYDVNSNEYKPFDLVTLEENEGLGRLQNFMEYSPFEVESSYTKTDNFKVLNFTGEVNDVVIDDIYRLLSDYYDMGKLFVTINC